MHKTRDATPHTLVVVVTSAAAHEVVMLDCARPVPFKVIVHRDVVVGEVLELEL